MTRTRKWSLLSALLVVVVLLAGWFLLVSPKRSNAADLRTQTASQESKNSDLKAQIADLQAKQKNLPQQKAIIAEIQQEIPQNPRAPGTGPLDLEHGHVGGGRRPHDHAGHPGGQLGRAAAERRRRPTARRCR